MYKLLFLICISELILKGNITSRTIKCQYGTVSYDCGAHGPNGQFCNYVGCGSDCCQIVWCSNYIGCFCEPGYAILKCVNT